MSHVKQVDISHKPFVLREAVAEGYLRLRPETIERIRKGEVEKGDPLQLAQLGGIIAAKETPRLLPLCHPIRIESVNVEVAIDEERSAVRARATVRALEQTGVEMEALAAVVGALLNVWDAVKQYEKDESGQYPVTELVNVRVVRKVKSGVG
ncbi:MAG: cyclic pyranopterin monophosphate synthase MoaC [Nitrososphaerota archaeon]|nr:cyclic pyranopterin monophosphate synthase MoaC [Candidatus Calditenuis fumarioli]